MSPSSLRPLALALCVLTLALPACVSTVKEEARACPCAAGWTCCEGQCVPGGPSACIVPDRSAPEAPRLEAAQPASPTSRREVTLSGHAEPHARVRVYTQPDCAGEAVAEATADAAGALQAGVTLAANQVSTYWARAVDAAGNGSQCSAPGLALRHDDVPPEAPLLTGASLGSATAAGSVQVLAAGRTEAYARVQLFADEGCHTALGVEGAGDAAGGFQLAMSVPARTPMRVYARAVDAAGNASACSAGLAFGQDEQAPEAPRLSAFVPASPSREHSASWQGEAEAGARLRVYATADCAGTPTHEQQVGEDARWAFPVLAADNATTRRWATVTDAAGNASACTLLGAYVHDTVPPRLEQVRVSPSAPTNAPDAALYGTTEPGATVYVSESYYCEVETALAAHPARADTGYFYFQVRLERSAQLYARAVDGAGNSSGCSSAGSFTYDVTPPEVPQLLALSEPSPGDATSAPAELSAVGTSEAGGTVAVYSDAACGVPVGFGTSDGGFRVGPLELIPAVDVALYARAWDAAGNASGCTPEPLRRSYAAQGLRWRPAEPGVAGAPWTLSALQLDGRGGLWAVRTTGTEYALSLEILRRDVAGGEWSAPRVLEPRLHHRAVGTAVNARGDLLVAWVGKVADESLFLTVRAARYDAEREAWSETGTYTIDLNANWNYASEDLSVALGDDGQALVCFPEWLRQGDSAISQRHCARAPAGGSWEAASLVAAGATDGRVQLLAGSDGSARALWREWAGNYVFTVRERLYSPQSGWGPATPVLTDVKDMHAALDASGTAWLAWTVDGGAEGLRTVWARRAPGVTAPWEPAQRVSAEGVPAYTPRVTGEGLVSWTKWTYFPSTERMWFAARTPEGWGEPVEVTMPGAGAQAPAPVAGAPGEVWFTWARGLYWGRGESAFFARRFTSAGGLEPVQTLMSDPVLNQLFDVHATADRTGRLAGAWQQYNSDAHPQSLQPRLRLLR